jgi:phage terminase small subunit
MPILSNSKHELFAQARAQGKSVDEAYVVAGYSANRGNAARLNANESVRKRIEEIMSEAAQKTGLTVQWVLDGLKLNYQRAMQAVAIKDHEGEPTGEFKYDGNVANKSLELIGKHLGMFKDKLELSGQVIVEIVRFSE